MTVELWEMTVELWERYNVSELLAQGYTSRHSGRCWDSNMTLFNHEPVFLYTNTNAYFCLFYKACVLLFSGMITWCLLITTTNSV
jgi:hypothetical protein